MNTFKQFLEEQTLLESEAFVELQKLIADEIGDSIAVLSKKVKSWALQQLPAASKSGSSVDLFKKIINHP